MANRNTYTHVQSTPSTTWSIEHGLDSVPVSDVVIGGQKVLPSDVLHIDQNNMQMVFATAQAGTARLVGKNVTFAPIGPGSIDFEGGGSGGGAPLPTFDAQDNSFDANGGNNWTGPFTVTRSSSVGAASVDWTITTGAHSGGYGVYLEGSGGAITSGTMNFIDGQSSESVNLTIDEGGGIFTPYDSVITISNPSSGFAIGDAEGTLTFT